MSKLSEMFQKSKKKSKGKSNVNKLFGYLCAWT